MSGQKVYKIFKETRGTVDFATLRDCLCLAPGIRFFSGNRKKGVFFCKRVFANFQTPQWHGRICLLRGRVLAGQKNCPAALHRKKSFFFFANAFLQNFKLRSGTAGFASSGAASWRSQKNFPAALHRKKRCFFCKRDFANFQTP